MKLTIKNSEIYDLNATRSTTFPKYTSQLINWANQNAQGTRPKIVGQMSDIFPQYQSETHDRSISTWEDWYEAKYSEAIDQATDKIMQQVQNLQSAIQLIDRHLVETWVRDLIVNKTYNGFCIQQAILQKLADRLGQTYRPANAYEESAGIDGFIGDVAYSVKPESYKTMLRLSEQIPVRMVYYRKTKTGLTIETEE